MCRAGRVRFRDEDEEGEQPSPKSAEFRTELSACLRIAIPLALANLLDRFSVWVTFAVIGRHGGAAEMGPASLASTLNNVLGTSVTIGLSLAVSTLASQAAGAGDMKALNLALQRALPVSFVFSVPVMTLLLTLGPVLRLLGRPADVAAAAAAYGYTILPVSLLTGAQRSMTAWLAALQITRPLLLINLALVPTHALLAYVLTFHTDLGYLGAGVAQSAQTAARVSCTYAYICFSARCRPAWTGFSPAAAMSGWSGYLRLALPGVLFLAEYWVGEFLIFTAALLPQPSVGLAAFAVYQLTNTTCYQPPGGLRVAVSSRVGRFLGAAEPTAAKRTWHAGLCLVGAWVGVPALLLFALPRAWAHIFTDEPPVVDLLISLVPTLVLYVGLDACLAIASGVLTGCGRQAIGGRLALISYVGCGLPCALALGFSAQLGVLGIALGHTLGKLVMTLATIGFVLRTDWPKQSQIAQQRIRSSRSSSHGADDVDDGAAPAAAAASSTTVSMTASREEPQPAAAAGDGDGDARGDGEERSDRA